MSTETGNWIKAQGLTPSLIWMTPTMRTRQTAEEILLVFSAPIPIQEAGVPELLEDWEPLVTSLEAEVPKEGVVLLVGHHPTMDMIKQEFGPLPVNVPRGNFAAAVVMEAGLSGWRCTTAWPGRPA